MKVNILRGKFLKRYNPNSSREVRRYRHRGNLNIKSQLFGNDPFINKKIGRSIVSKGGKA